MKRFISRFISLVTLLAATLSVLAGAASAAGSWVHNDGVAFDSEVGAVCGALTTNVYFEPGESSIDLYDQAPLAYLAGCMSFGALRAQRIAVVGYGDVGVPVAEAKLLGRERVAQVSAWLVSHGVSPSQLVEVGHSWAPDWPLGSDDYARAARVEFRIVGATPIREICE